MSAMTIQVTGRSCVFCGRRPVTNEHVWPEWVGDLISSLTTGPFTINRFGKTWTTGKIDQKVRRVCETCNHNWMSQLEDNIIPLLSPMISGRYWGTRLSPSDQYNLARWVYKTALMADFSLKGRLLTDDVYRGFYKHRMPADQCVIWTAAYGGDSAAINLHRSTGALTGLMDHRFENLKFALPRAPYYSYTFNLHRVVFQVLIYKGDYVPSHDDGGQAYLRIWPVNFDVVSWPPDGVAISHESLEVFANRRNRLI